MSRVLFSWELGSNLGHVSRLLPLARRLKARGHAVLVAANQLTLAAKAFGPAAIAFVQAPQLPFAPRSREQPASYADVLLNTGWSNTVDLWSAVQAWVSTVRLFAPDVIVADHSPTALLARRITGHRCALIGTGFELPPLADPLPAFPGFPGATTQAAMSATARALESANRVLVAMRAPQLRTLSELFPLERRWLMTFAELDHYGARSGERYVGSIGELDDGERVEWPTGPGPRVFAYLRPEIPGLAAILEALSASDAAIVCAAPGLGSPLIQRHSSGRFLISTRPVHLRPLLDAADLCVSYSPAGTITTALLRGVPQLMFPTHVEAQLTAHRVECLGAGLTLRGAPDVGVVTSMLRRLLTQFEFKARAITFAEKYRDFEPAEVVNQIVRDIEDLATSGKGEGRAA
jgi:UDP:flavonoid glycosyltransferase YjiC (YdhE family)